MEKITANINFLNYKSLPKEPLWNEIKQFSINNRSYVEFPFYYPDVMIASRNNSTNYYKLQAYKDKSNQITLRVVKFFAIDLQKKMIDFDVLSTNNIKDFTGFVTVFDIDKNMTSVGRYMDGEKSKRKYQYASNEETKGDGLLPYVEPSCLLRVESYMCTRTCYWVGNPDNIISCTGWDCEVDYYYTCVDGEDGGGNPDEGSNSYSSSTTVKVEAEDRIINELTGKALCVYNKMVDSNNNINWILENFNDGDKPSEFNLRLQMSTTLDDFTNASTSKSGNTFTIKINANTLPDRTSLGIARTILHEGIHTRLREFASRKGSNATTFPSIYEYFRLYKGNWDH